MINVLFNGYISSFIINIIIIVLYHLVYACMCWTGRFPHNEPLQFFTLHGLVPSPTPRQADLCHSSRTSPQVFLLLPFSLTPNTSKFLWVDTLNLTFQISQPITYMTPLSHTYFIISKHKIYVITK